MSKIKLGKIAITPKGEYASGTIYERLDAVRYNGSSWLVLQRCSGVTPTEGAFYTLLAEKGGKGDQGLSSYDSWLAQGNKGTEAEFVASLSNQADWNENNETSAAFVKNRTHYVIPGTETKTNTLTWDGDTEGKNVVQLSGMMLIKVSNEVVDMADVIGATIIAKSVDGDLNPVEQSLTVAGENVADLSAEGINGYVLCQNAVFVIFEDFSAPGMNLTKGIWFYRNAPGEIPTYVKSLTCLTDCFVLKTPETVVPLDGKFLPKGLGYIIKEGDQIATNTLTFDGNIEGKEYVDEAFVKMSDKVITVNDLIGATVVLSMGGEEMSVTLTADDIQDMSTEGAPAIYVVPQALELPAVMIFADDYSADGMTVTKGIYFVYAEEEGETVYTKSLTCLTDCFVVGTPTEVKKIDNRLLDVEWLATKSLREVELVPETSITDGGLTYTENVAKLVAGQTYVVNFGNNLLEQKDYECVAKSGTVDDMPIVFIGNGVYLGGNYDGENTGEPFCYFTYLAVNGAAFLSNCTSKNPGVVRITTEEKVPDKLPEEFLPETLLATIANLEARIAKLEGATE